MQILIQEMKDEDWDFAFLTGSLIDTSATLRNKGRGWRRSRLIQSPLTPTVETFIIYNKAFMVIFVYLGVRNISLRRLY